MKHIKITPFPIVLFLSILLTGCGACPEEANQAEASALTKRFQALYSAVVTVEGDCPQLGVNVPADEPPPANEPPADETPPVDEAPEDNIPPDAPPGENPNNGGDNPPNNPPNNPGNETPAPPVAATGKALYEATCAQCHGQDGAGVVDQGPSLLKADCQICSTIAPLEKFIHDNMPQNDTALCTGECAALTALYIALELEEQPAPPPPVVPVMETRTGEQIYQEECAGCHAGGDAPPLMPEVCGLCGNISALFEKIDQQMPPGDPQICTGECAARVSRFIFDGMSPVPVRYTRREYYDGFGCADCHGAQGEGGTGPALNMGAADYLALVDKIAQTMPQAPHPALCVDDCAVQIAQLIFFEFKEHERFTGAQLYQLNCETCHGDQGQGVTAPALNNENCQVCGNFTELVNKINLDMPQNNSQLCLTDAEDQCAVKVAEFISTGFNADQPLSGEDHYAIKCAGCHGANGEGGQGPAFMIGACTTCENVSDLYFKILETMPQSAPELCQGECALLTTAYVYSLSHPEDVIDDDPADDPMPPPVVDENPGNTPGEPVVLTGSEYYANLCAGCHGEKGEGMDESPALLSYIGCCNLSDLISRIEEAMPKPEPSACVGECAMLVADYIQGGFKEAVAQDDPAPMDEVGEEVPQKDDPEEIPEETPEEIPPVEIPEEISPEEIPEEAPEEIPEEIPQNDASEEVEEISHDCPLHNPHCLPVPVYDCPPKNPHCAPVNEEAILEQMQEFLESIFEQIEGR